MRIHLAALLAGAVLAEVLPVAATANDSSAELSIGGLVFKRNADVSIESEELIITPETVTVRYQFLNQSTSPVTLTVAFPLPDIDLSEPDTNWAFPVGDAVNFVGFKTKIDGKPVTFNIHQRALLDGKDVTDTIRGAGLALLPIGAPQAVEFGSLPEAKRKQLIDRGLYVQSGADQKGQPLYNGTWTVKTSVVREQKFPPGQPIAVEHTYNTSVGMSFDSILRPGLRRAKGVAQEVARYKSTYCITDDFFRSIDRLAGSSEANVGKIEERRISYVLQTGANWSGPIRDFRLVVDKGKPDRLVSFCGDNIKKISPTAFEVRMKDFTPDRDLKILIVARPS
jgi:hypothetical protein